MGAPVNELSEEELSAILKPVLLLWGDHDPVESVDIGHKVANLLPLSEFHAMEEAEHLSWLDDPAACSRFVKQFLLRLTGKTMGTDLEPYSFPRTGF